MAAPFRRWQFRRLLSFRAWLSLANGISQAAEKVFPKNVLKLGVGDMAIMRNAMQIGQIGVSRWAGPFSDRYGNRPVLVACQWMVSIAMIFYLIASPGPAWHAWLLLGAWVLWSFYAGHNVCLPNLALKLAPVQEKSPYVAANEAVASLFHGVITLVGGFLFDWLNDSQTFSRLGSAAHESIRDDIQHCIGVTSGGGAAGHGSCRTRRLDVARNTPSPHCCHCQR